MLEQELAAYAKNRSTLLGTAEGKFVLVREAEVVGVYESKADAIAEGYRRFGNVPFLVKQVLKVELPQNFVSRLLAV